jgi:hypothetical protein
MDVQELAKYLSKNFIGFRGGAEQLVHDLFQQADLASLRDVPSNATAFTRALTAVGTDLLALGVSVKVAPGGMITILAASEAQKSEQEEASLRASFNSSLPEAQALRQEFGNDFDRFASYRRGLRLGHIHEPRRGRNVVDQEDKGAHATVDATLPMEQRLLKRWNHEPFTRKSFTSVEAFIAYEKANAQGLVRKLG